MGRAPCCDKASVKRGPWSPEEDAKLKDYMEIHGTGGNWITLPRKAGLKRCGKSCRLRWLNYLRPDIKHGEFSDDEDRIICTLFANIGSRWSIIAAQLPGRTDNDIKNYWNTKLKKKFTMHISANNGQRMSSSSEQHLLFNHSSPAIPPARSVLRSPNSDHFYKLTPFSSTSSSTSVTNPPFTGHEAASCTTSDVSSSMDLDRIHPHQQQMLINDLQGFSPPYNRESEIFSGDQKIANYRVGIPMDRYGIEEISQLISGSSPYSNVATLDNNNSSYNSMIRELISSSSYHSNAATSGNNDCSYNSFLFGGVENRSIMTSDSPNLDTGADEGFLYYNY